MRGIVRQALEVEGLRVPFAKRLVENSNSPAAICLDFRLLVLARRRCTHAAHSRSRAQHRIASVLSFIHTSGRKYGCLTGASRAALMASFPKRRRSPRLLCTGILLLCAGQGRAFSMGANRPSTLLSLGSNGRSTLAVAAESSTAHALQRVWDELVDGAELQDVEKLLTGVKSGLFPQASAWAKTWTPMRCVVAEVGDSRSISILVLPREYDTLSRVLWDVQYRHTVIYQSAFCFCLLLYCNTFFGTYTIASIYLRLLQAGSDEQFTAVSCAFLALFFKPSRVCI